MFNFVRYSKIYYAFSGVLFLTSVFCLFSFGLKFGIDFTGGSILEVSFESRPENAAIEEKLKDLELGEVVIQPAGDRGVILRMKEVPEEVHQIILSRLGELGKAEELSFESIGPTIGKELREKTEKAIVFALLAITFYIAFAFRKISRVISSWQCGAASLVALCHDILVPLGLFAVLGRFYSVEVTIPIIAALLTILGFSIHDTIVIFDRVRENVIKGGYPSFEETVNASLNQTLGRSINTVLTVLIVLFSIFFFGGETLRYFSLALIVGIASGAYSSIFIAGPLLATWLNWGKRR